MVDLIEGLRDAFEKDADNIRGAIRAERAWYMLAMQVAFSALEHPDSRAHREAAKRALSSRLSAIYESHPELKP